MKQYLYLTVDDGIRHIEPLASPLPIPEEVPFAISPAVILFGTCRVFGGDLSFPQYDWLFNFHGALIAKTTFRAIP